VPLKPARPYPINSIAIAATHQGQFLQCSICGGRWLEFQI
jgi:hypothetical protein